MRNRTRKPLKSAQAKEAAAFAIDVQVGIPRFWTGAVWQIIPILRGARPDLIMLPIDTEPTGRRSPAASSTRPFTRTS